MRVVRVLIYEGSQETLISCARNSVVPWIGQQWNLKSNVDEVGQEILKIIEIRDLNKADKLAKELEIDGQTSTKR